MMPIQFQTTDNSEILASLLPCLQVHSLQLWAAVGRPAHSCGGPWQPDWVRRARSASSGDSDSGPVSGLPRQESVPGDRIRVVTRKARYSGSALGTTHAPDRPARVRGPAGLPQTVRSAGPRTPSGAIWDVCSRPDAVLFPVCRSLCWSIQKRGLRKCDRS